VLPLPCSPPPTYFFTLFLSSDPPNLMSNVSLGADAVRFLTVVLLPQCGGCVSQTSLSYVSTQPRFEVCGLFNSPLFTCHRYLSVLVTSGPTDHSCAVFPASPLLFRPFAAFFLSDQLDDGVDSPNVFKDTPSSPEASFGKRYSRMNLIPVFM